LSRSRRSRVRVALRILRSSRMPEDVSQDVFTEASGCTRRPCPKLDGLARATWTLRSLDRLRRNRPSSNYARYDRMSTVEPFEELGGSGIGRLAAERRLSTARPAGHGLRDAHIRATIARRAFRQPWASPPKLSRRRCTKRRQTSAETIGRLQPRRFKMNDNHRPTDF